MVHVQVSEHRMVNTRRRSLCDNCSVRGCTNFNGSRVMECREFKPLFIVFMKCKECGTIYDLYQNFSSLDYELCPGCNHTKKEKDGMTLICRS